jgi:hypothetical protein
MNNKKKSHDKLKFDVKRSSERKKTAEENRGKTDKKAQAMDLLKAKRQAKIDRGNRYSVNIIFLNLTRCCCRGERKGTARARK